jgi:transcriptional regulator with XRE-family HTH domain
MIVKGTTMSNVGIKVFELRRLREMSQASLAEAIGTERAWVSRLETGAKVNITMRLLEKLAAALQTTPQNLIR